MQIAINQKKKTSRALIDKGDQGRRTLAPSPCDCSKIAVNQPPSVPSSLCVWVWQGKLIQTKLKNEDEGLVFTMWWVWIQLIYFNELTCHLHNDVHFNYGKWMTSQRSTNFYLWLRKTQCSTHSKNNFANRKHWHFYSCWTRSLGMFLIWQLTYGLPFK